MELIGSHYFDTLVTFSVTFAGFAVLVAAFRQVIGGRLSAYDVYVIRTTLVRSFIVAGCSMLPSLLALYELAHRSVWRVSSVVTALLLFLFSLAAYLTRRAAIDIPIGSAFVAIIFCQVIVAIALLASAFGIFFEPAAGPYATAGTAIMILALVSYVASLNILLRGEQTEK